MGTKIKLRVAKTGDYIPVSGAAESLIINAVSPVVTFEPVEGGTKMIVTDVDGTKETIIHDGTAELEFDSSPREGSSNPVTSNGINAALDWLKQDLKYFIDSNTDAIQDLDAAIDLKQDKLFFDSAPSENSTNPVTSKGIYAAIHNGDRETISGTTASIFAQAGKRYVCGTLEELKVYPPPTGIFSVRFKSGETPTSLSVLGTSKWNAGFDP